MAKELRCPNCKKRLIDEGSKTESKILIVNDEEDVADYYLKCERCKNLIGIKKIN